MNGPAEKYMMYVIYDIILHLSILALTPYFLIKMLSAGKYRSGIPERFGIIKDGKLKAVSGGRVAWFHAVSVGETKAVLPLVKAFREKNPGTKIVFSTVTKTGHRVAKKEGALLIDTLIYFPLDLSWIARSVVRRLNPCVFIVVEKELWPNLIRHLRGRSIPVVVVNGTLSERSFERYRRFSFLFGKMFRSLSAFCARTGEDAKKALALGAERRRVVVTGNLKFDMEPRPLDAAERELLVRSLGIGPEDRVIVAGSTHSGEEKVLLDAFKRLKGEFKRLKIVLAPRHPERFDEVESIVRASGLPYIRRSRGAKDNGHDVVILDTIGELGMVYSLATAAFVGGTLVDTGGHNLFEPALYGKPVLYGPYLRDYLYMAEILEKEGASFRVKEGDLACRLKTLLKDHGLRAEMGRAAARVVESNRGATARTLDVIEAVTAGRTPAAAEGAG